MPNGDDNARFQLTIYRDGVAPEVKDFEIPEMDTQLAVQAPWTKLTVKNFTPDFGLDFTNPGGGEHLQAGDGEITGLDPTEDVYVLATSVDVRPRRRCRRGRRPSLIAFWRPTTGWLLQPLAAPCRATPAQMGFPPTHHALVGTPWHGLGMVGRFVGASGHGRRRRRCRIVWSRCRTPRSWGRIRWRTTPGSKSAPPGVGGGGRARRTSSAAGSARGWTASIRRGRCCPP